MDTRARGSRIADMKSVRFLGNMNHYLGNNHSYLQYLEYFRSECEHRMDLTEKLTFGLDCVRVNLGNCANLRIVVVQNTTARKHKNSSKAIFI